jgi:uncharacterized protein YbaA (DUF1428 family)
MLAGMVYADGFLLVVPKKNLRKYTAIAKKAGKVWRDHGALEYRECVGDDLKTKMGMPFPKMTKAKAGDAVVFSWIVYKSRAHRDAVNKKVMQDARMQKLMKEPMPFDLKRMSYGGFASVVDL